MRQEWQPRVTVVLFGSIRSIRWTRDSIQRNVLGWNASRGVAVTSFASINLFETIDNPRSGESGLQLDRGDLILLPADQRVVIEQSDDDIRDELEVARRAGDFYDNGFRSVRNLLHQLNSLRAAWAAISRDDHLSTADYFLFARPDLRYNRPVQLSRGARRLETDNSVLVPEWQSFGGFNDRIALADRRGAYVYANRLDHVSAYCATGPLQAERFLGFCLEEGAVRVGRLQVSASRVRGDGSVVKEAFGKSRRRLPLRPQPATSIPTESRDTVPLRVRDTVAAAFGRRGA